MNPFGINAPQAPPHPLMHVLDDSAGAADPKAFDGALQEELDVAPADTEQTIPAAEGEDAQVTAATKRSTGAAPHAAQVPAPVSQPHGADLVAAAPQLPPRLERDETIPPTVIADVPPPAVAQNTTPLSQALATLVSHVQALAKNSHTPSADNGDEQLTSPAPQPAATPHGTSQTAAQTASTFAGLLSPSTPHPQAVPMPVASHLMPAAWVHGLDAPDALPFALPAGAQRVHLRLTPEALGVVDLEIRVRDAVVTLAVRTDSSAALQHLVQHRDQLDSQLREHGLSLGDMHMGHHAAGDEGGDGAHHPSTKRADVSLHPSSPNSSAAAPTRKRGGIDVVA